MMTYDLLQGIRRNASRIRGAILWSLITFPLIFAGCQSSSSDFEELPGRDTSSEGTTIALRMRDDIEFSDIRRVEITVTGPGIPLFQTEALLPTGTSPEDVAVGTLQERVDAVTGTAPLDIVTANNFGESVTIQLQQDECGVEENCFSHQDIPLGFQGGPIAVALGDIDGDSYLDIITANVFVGNLTVFYGMGGGNFADPLCIELVGRELGDIQVASECTELLLDEAGFSSLALGYQEESFVIDFIAVANRSRNNVTVLLNEGGHFRLLEPIPVGLSPSALAIGDIAHGGPTVIVVANSGENNLSVIKRRSQKDFGDRSDTVSLTEADGPSALDLGYVNPDNYLDIVVANTFSNNLSILLGNREGTFSESRISPFNLGTGGPSAVVLADAGKPLSRRHTLDGNQIADIIVAYQFTGDLSVLLGGEEETREGNTFVTFDLQPRVVVGLEPIALALGELDDDIDRNLDVAVVNRGSDDVLVLSGAGDGGFLIQPGFPVAPDMMDASPLKVATGKVHDERPEKLVAIAVEQTPNMMPGRGTMNDMTHEIRMYMRRDTRNMNSNEEMNPLELIYQNTRHNWRATSIGIGRY